MKATTKALIAALVAVAASVGLIVWQAKHSRAYAALTSLTPEDMSLIAESLAPADRMKLSTSPEERKKLADDVRRMLAVAAARRSARPRAAVRGVVARACGPRALWAPGSYP